MMEINEVEIGRRLLDDYYLILEGTYLLWKNENVPGLSPLIVNALDRLKEVGTGRKYALKHFNYDISEGEIRGLWEGRITQDRLAEMIFDVGTLLHKIS